MEVETISEPLFVADENIEGNPRHEDPFVVSFFGAGANSGDVMRAREVFEYRYGPRGYYAPATGLPLLPSHSRVRFETPKARANFHASEISEMAGDRHIVMSGSSAGFTDTMDTLEAMLEKDLHNTEVTILVTNTPGLTENGFKGVARFARDWVKMFRTMNLVEQHITYPGPEKLYQNPSSPPTVEGKSVTTFEDTPQERDIRRRVFKHYLEHFIPDEKARGEYIDALRKIDAEIEIAYDMGDEKNVDELFEKRGKFIGPYKEKYFHGGLVDEAHTNRYLEEYKEVKRSLLTRVGMFAQSILFAARLVGDVRVGNERRLARVARLAANQGVTVRLGVAVTERDVIVPPVDLQKIVTNFQEVGLDIAWLGYFENLGHVTVGQYPEAIVKAIDSMLGIS